MRQAKSAAIEERLVDALAELVATPERTDRAALAALRRGLGQEPGSVPGMFRHLPLLARVDQRNEEAAFLVASLFGWHPVVEWSTGDATERVAGSRASTRNFGNSLAHLVRELNRRTPASARPPGGPPTEGAGGEPRPTVAPQPQPGVERRFVALLAADRADLPDHLRALVGLLRQHDVPVDWLQLLRDIHRWDDSDRRVQRRWARSFWGRVQVEQMPPSIADSASAE